MHDVLEAWYWISVFSGDYDKDQNVTMINNLQALSKYAKERNELTWLKKGKDNIMNFQNFSDKEFLLLQKVDEDRYPKNVMKHFMCQYLLSKTYPDMFDSQKTINVFCNEAAELEAHHIIPLGTVSKIGESTSSLRKNPKNICNSPLNFVYITKQSNKEISDDSLDIYVQKITDEAKSELFISSYVSTNVANDDKKTQEILAHRFDSLKGNIKNHVNQLLS